MPPGKPELRFKIGAETQEVKYPHAIEFFDLPTICVIKTLTDMVITICLLHLGFAPEYICNWLTSLEIHHVHNKTKDSCDVPDYAWTALHCSIVQRSSSAVVADADVSISALLQLIIHNITASCERNITKLYWDVINHSIVFKNTFTAVFRIKS